MSENSDAWAITLWVFVLTGLAIALALIVAPIAAHMAWNVFIHFWNVV